MSEKQCEHVEQCPIFKYFKRIAQRVYMDLYCLGDYERCERRKLRLANKPVPENLLPHGGTLWDEEYNLRQSPD